MSFSGLHCQWLQFSLHLKSKVGHRHLQRCSGTQSRPCCSSRTLAEHPACITYCNSHTHAELICRLSCSSHTAAELNACIAYCSPHACILHGPFMSPCHHVSLCCVPFPHPLKTGDALKLVPSLFLSLCIFRQSDDRSPEPDLQSVTVTAAVGRDMHHFPLSHPPLQLCFNATAARQTGCECENSHWNYADV